MNAQILGYLIGGHNRARLGDVAGLQRCSQVRLISSAIALFFNTRPNLLRKSSIWSQSFIILDDGFNLVANLLASVPSAVDDDFAESEGPYWSLAASYRHHYRKCHPNAVTYLPQRSGARPGRTMDTFEGVNTHVFWFVATPSDVDPLTPTP